MLASALIIIWDSTTFTTWCPYCNRSHCHAWTENHIPLVPIYLSPCSDDNDLREYRPIKPGEEPFRDYGWELNRAAMHCQAVDPLWCVGLPAGRILGYYWKELEPQTEENIMKLAVKASTDLDPLPPSTYEITIDKFDHLQYRLDLFLEACRNSDISSLTRLFACYKEDHLELRRDTTGTTGLHLAACEEDGLETVKILLANGAKLNERDHFGRTPLMEAALFGRLETFFHLLNEPRIDYMARDAKKLGAWELARFLPRNVDERIDRSCDEPPIPHETRRKMLKRLEVVAKTALDPDIPTQRSPNSALGFPWNDPTKAYACLDRGEGYPLIIAVSGWMQPVETWGIQKARAATDAALITRDHLGSDRDEDAASHVEPKLATDLVNHCTLLWLKGNADEVASLAKVALPYRLKPAILISKPKACGECKDYIAKLEGFARNSGVDLNIEWIWDVRIGYFINILTRPDVIVSKPMEG